MSVGGFLALTVGLIAVGYGLACWLWTRIKNKAAETEQQFTIIKPGESMPWLHVEISKYIDDQRKAGIRKAARKKYRLMRSKHAPTPIRKRVRHEGVSIG